MKKEIKIKVKPRDESGKEAATRLRHNGLVPAIVYGRGKKPAAISISEVELIHALHTSAGENVIINLNIDKEGKAQNKTVIIKNIQYHPIKSNIIHVDFLQIALDEKITVKVPVEVKGEAVGVKRDDGVLDHALWEVEVECLPTNIPEKFEVKVDEMEIGDTIQVKDIEVPEGVKILNDIEETVVILEPPRKGEEEVAAEEAVEAEEQEPEVIGEKEREERKLEKEKQDQQQKQEQKPEQQE